VETALTDAGCDLVGLTLERADGGRAQLYVAELADGGRRFVKVFAQDSRDADLLYRAYRTLLLRGPTDDLPSLSLAHDVEHEALLLVLAQRAGINSPALDVLVTLPDGSMALSLQDVEGLPLALGDAAVAGPLLDAVWREVATLHAANIAHRALHPSNILLADGRPVLVDFGAAEASASPRLLAIDRAELLASTATLVGADVAVAAAARTLTPDELAAAVPYLQPLALSASTRSAVSKSLLDELRTAIAETTGVETPPLERLQRVRPRTILTIVTLTGAFYLILPQLADVGDSFTALRSANWAWLGVCVVMSASTYIASTVGLLGGVPGHLPFFATLQAQFASSFVNRVTPANVGGMALNVRYMQKAGVDPAQAVTGIGLNVAAGGFVHAILLLGFFAWAGQSSSGAFELPASSKVVAGIAVLFALFGVFSATARGRRLLKTHVLSFLKRSWTNITTLARSPLRLLALLGGSFGVTLAYICALAAAAAAYDGDASFAQVGAVYLGSSVLAAAAPTPGGLGAMEAALVAGFTGVGMDPGIAVAAVLSYRLATYWLPIGPGWIAFQLMERRNLI
jgi:undecaprenyl-diphosphatase